MKGFKALRNLTHPEPLRQVQNRLTLDESDNQPSTNKKLRSNQLIREIIKRYKVELP